MAVAHRVAGGRGETGSAWGAGSGAGKRIAQRPRAGVVMRAARRTSRPASSRRKPRNRPPTCCPAQRVPGVGLWKVAPRPQCSRWRGAAAPMAALGPHSRGRRAHGRSRREVATAAAHRVAAGGNATTGSARRLALAAGRRFARRPRAGIVMRAAWRTSGSGRQRPPEAEKPSTSLLPRGRALSARGRRAAAHCAAGGTTPKRPVAQSVPLRLYR